MSPSRFPHQPRARAAEICSSRSGAQTDRIYVSPGERALRYYDVLCSDIGEVRARTREEEKSLGGLGDC